MTALAGLALLVVVAGGVFWLRREFIVVTVQGDSMTPTLKNGQRLMARRFRPGETCAMGDIIVFSLTAEQLARPETAADPPHRVKRVAAIAGSAVPEWLREARGLPSGSTIPVGHVAVRGDNPASEDSRQLGFVDLHSVQAIVRSPPRVE